MFNQGKNCWRRCSRRGGDCPRFCGADGACCRVDRPFGKADPASCGARGCKGYHCCIPNANVDQVLTDFKSITNDGRNDLSEYEEYDAEYEGSGENENSGNVATNWVAVGGGCGALVLVGASFLVLRLRRTSSSSDDSPTCAEGEDYAHPDAAARNLTRATSSMMMLRADDKNTNNKRKEEEEEESVEVVNIRRSLKRATSSTDGGTIYSVRDGEDPMIEDEQASKKTRKVEIVRIRHLSTGSRPTFQTTTPSEERKRRKSIPVREMEYV